MSVPADDGGGEREAAPPAGFVSMPTHPVGPLTSVLRRLLYALALLALATILVYLDRYGYRDYGRPGKPLTVLSSVYYATVTLSTTGYGDIVPVSSTARLVNTVLITPIRLMFLLVLVGTTLEVLAERTRRRWRIARWRARVSGHVVVVGYGTTGRAVIRTLTEHGTRKPAIVVVDVAAEAAAEANAAGLIAVTGDATRSAVLHEAEVAKAGQVVVAVNRDDTAVLVVLTARQLNPAARISAAVREEENRDLLHQSGADHVVVSSDAAGQMLGVSTVRPAAAKVIADLLDRGQSLDLFERSVAADEVGKSPQAAGGTVIAVLRGGEVLPPHDPRAAHLHKGDQLILVHSQPRRPGLFG